MLRFSLLGYSPENRLSRLNEIKEILNIAERRQALVDFRDEEKRLLRQGGCGGILRSQALTKVAQLLERLDNPLPNNPPGVARSLF